MVRPAAVSVLAKDQPILVVNAVTQMVAKRG